MRSIAATVECYIKKDGKYLMLHRNKNKKIMPDVWMAPGGKREFNEGLFEATRREVEEETGLKIKNLRIKATGNAYMKDIDMELVFHFVFADYAGGELKEDTASDGELRWLTVEEMLQLPNLLSEVKEVAQYIFSDDQEVISYKAVYEEGNKLSEFTLESPE